MPSYGKWHKEFAKQGVTILGIHTPETPEEKVRANILRKVKELKITYPVLLDMQSKNWAAWGTRYWPSVYLIDKRGRARFGWEGELEWQGAKGTAKMAEKIRLLLKEEVPAEENRLNEKQP